MSKKRMNKFHIAFLCMILFLMLVMFSFYAKEKLESDITAASFVPAARFEGEYSLDGKSWEAYSENVQMNALHGDVFLRGKMHYGAKGPDMYLYEDHIFAEVTVDGRVLCSQLNSEYQEGATCSRTWLIVPVEDLREDSIWEIHLRNAHHSGNPLAYKEFLSNIYIGSYQEIQRMMLHINKNLFSTIADSMQFHQNLTLLITGYFWKNVGIMIMIMTFILFGVAFADITQNSFFGIRLWILTAFTFCMGQYMYLDNPLISLLHGDSLLFSIGAAFLKDLIILLFCGICTFSYQDQYQKAGFAVTCGLGIFTGAVYTFCKAGSVRLGSVSELFELAYAVALLALLILGILCIRQGKTKYLKTEEIMGIYVFGSVMLLEIANNFIGIWGRNMLVFLAFTILFFFFYITEIRKLPKIFSQSEKAVQLEQTLYQNRVELAYSQIQPHFLYNTLGTISMLCMTSPQLASDATKRFAEYLRVNLDSLNKRENIAFLEELEHVKTYLWLEKMRFGEELNVEYQIQESNFMIPVLSLQPLVENAVIHGYMNSENPCLIRIGTRIHGSSIEISIKDNGGGFDIKTLKAEEEKHIGISSVRKRLRYLCDGTLSISSEKGIGTEVIIKLPYHKRNSEKN